MKVGDIETKYVKPSGNGDAAADEGDNEEESTRKRVKNDTRERALVPGQSQETCQDIYCLISPLSTHHCPVMTSEPLIHRLTSSFRSRSSRCHRVPRRQNLLYLARQRSDAETWPTRPRLVFDNSFPLAASYNFLHAFVPCRACHAHMLLSMANAPQCRGSCPESPIRESSSFQFSIFYRLISAVVCLGTKRPRLRALSA